MIRFSYKIDILIQCVISEILTSDKMVQFSSISTLVVLFTAFSVKGFLLNTNTSNHLLSSVQTTGYDANTIIHLFKRIDDLQLQIRQQSKTLEAQKKPMEVQANVIQQLLNFTKQAPSAVSLSNDLSILQTYVRGMLTNIINCPMSRMQPMTLR